MKRTSDQISGAETSTPSKKARKEVDSSPFITALETNEATNVLDGFSKEIVRSIDTPNLKVDKLSVATLNWLVTKVRASWDAGLESDAHHAFVTCEYLLVRALVEGRTDLVDALVGEHKVSVPMELNLHLAADDYIPEETAKQLILFAEAKHPCMPAGFIQHSAPVLAWDKPVFDFLLEKIPSFRDDIKSGAVLEHLFVQDHPSRLMSYLHWLGETGLQLTAKQFAQLPHGDNAAFADPTSQNALCRELTALCLATNPTVAEYAEALQDKLVYGPEPFLVSTLGHFRDKPGFTDAVIGLARREARVEGIHATNLPYLLDLLEPLLPSQAEELLDCLERTDCGRLFPNARLRAIQRRLHVVVCRAHKRR